MSTDYPGSYKISKELMRDVEAVACVILQQMKPCFNQTSETVVSSIIWHLQQTEKRNKIEAIKYLRAASKYDRTTVSLQVTELLRSPFWKNAVTYAQEQNNMDGLNFLAVVRHTQMSLEEAKGFVDFLATNLSDLEARAAEMPQEGDK
jgi:ribosomal protein L7/L12